MKKILLFLVLFSSVTFVSKAQDQFKDWPALGEFHEIMAATFHPAEDGNLEPARQRTGELLDKADLLEKSVVPEKYNTPALKAAVKTLVKNTDKLYGLIKKRGTDDKVKAQLTVVHDSFHKIVGLCTDPKN